ncbi:MAG: response regulator [Planctomycetota bacterium]
MQHVLLTNPEALITVGKAAELCQVYRGTVQRWIASSKLKAHKLPSGHYRIRVGDLHNFLAINKLPTPLAMRSEDGGRLRILIVDRSEQNRKKLKSALSSLDGDIAEAGNGVDALLKIGEWKPCLVILNLKLEDIDGVVAVQAVSNNPATKHTRFLINSGADDSVKKKLNRNASVVGYMNQPTPAESLRKQVQASLAKGSKYEADRSHGGK